MARRIRGQLLDGMLETMTQPTIGLDRSGAVRFYSESFKKLYPELKEGKTLWQSLASDDFVRWVSDCLDSTDPTLREQIMTHFQDGLWMARLEPIFGDAGRCSGFILSLQDIGTPEPISDKFDTLLNEVRAGLSRPLAGIKTRLEVLLEGAYKEQDVLVELLQQLNEDSNQLARLLFSLEAPGAEPEDLMKLDIPSLIIPGNDDFHATSAARYLHECLAGSEYWDVPVDEQEEENAPRRVLEFLNGI